MKISIALTCRDELGNLPEVLERLKWLESALKDDLWEVVIVDGGSTDGSREFLVEAAAAWPKLRVIDQQPPHGYGSGYRQSILACAGDVIVTCDTDLNYDVRDCTRMLPLLSTYDLVVANPLLEGGVAELGYVRLLPTTVVAWLYRMALVGRGIGVTVFTPILRVGWARVFKGALPKADDFRTSAEVMMRILLTQGARVCEVPVIVHKRGAGRSKMRFSRTVLAHLALLGSVVAFRLFRREAL